jgi:phosphate transport system substrate-binding protein
MNTHGLFGKIGVIATILSLTFTLGAQAEEIKIAAGAGPVENVLKPVKEAFEKATGIKLTITSSGATIAFRDLVKGNLDASAAGFSFEELVQEEKKEGFDVPNPTAYSSIEVAKAGIVLLAHKDNPVSKLSKEQIKGIFTGKIQSWKDVGGSDNPILVAVSKLNPATNASFRKVALDGEAFAKDVADTTTIDDLKNFITQTPESIGFGPSTSVGGSIKQIETIEISRVITVITKGAPSPKVQKLIDFIKGDGKSYVKK